MDLIINTIHQDNPNFFNEFKSEISSKDHLRIKQALINGGEIYYEAVKTIYPEVEIITEALQADVESGRILTNGKLDNKKLEDQFPEYEKLLTDNPITSPPSPEYGNDGCSIVLACAAAVVLAVYFAAAVHNTAAITAIVAVVWAVKVKKGQQSYGKSEEDELAFEMLVDDIANL